VRRADRLFQILQLLRGRDVVKAAELAEELEVSLRTVYRDVRDLMASGVPVEGEAGVGYYLADSFDLPPLMFDAEEVRALVLGARMVQGWGDAGLARHARSVLSKVEAVLPESLRPHIDDVELYVPLRMPAEIRANVETFRQGSDLHRKVRFGYTDHSGTETTRTVRPLCLVFWGMVWTASGWCELRRDFRTFRPDRMREVLLTEETFEDEPGKDLATFRQSVWPRRED
jgi:predicted DNA-binding transcriptional regulator YafY